MLRIDDGSPAPRVQTEPVPPDPTQHGTTPQTVTQPTQSDPPPLKTPAQAVDLAVTNYKAAVASGNPDAIKKARQDVYTAVRNEVGPQVDAANKYIPPDFQTPAADQITAYGNIILRRNASDPATRGVLQDAINDYKIQRQADSLVPSFYGNFTPKEKLDTLKLSLQGQSPEVVARVMQNPAVQKMLQDAQAWIAAPYNQKGQSEGKMAFDASQRLADITADLPPEYAAQIVKQSMPTIQKITAEERLGGAQATFVNLSKVVDSLRENGSEGPQAQALTVQIAQAYSNQAYRWSGQFNADVKEAIDEGSTPTLALAIAQQLRANGKTDAADSFMGGILRGIADLQAKVKGDATEYSEQTRDLTWLAASSKDKLTPDQYQQAVDHYIASQGAGWKDKLNEISDRMTNDVATLGQDVGVLEGAPDNIKQAYSDIFDSVKFLVHDDDQVQNAIAFSMLRDPAMFAGEAGDKWASLIIEETHLGKDFLEKLGSAYVAGHVMPALQFLNSPDHAQAGNAYRALDDLRDKGVKFWGLPPDKVNESIDKLEEMASKLDTMSVDELQASFNKGGVLSNDLNELRDMTASQGLAGLTFRTLALAISGKAFLNATGEEFESPNAQKLLGVAATSVGMAQDAVKFGLSVKMVDPEGAAAKWATGGAAERLFGVLQIAYFAAGAYQDFTGGDAPAVAFDVVGAGGAAVATFGEAVGLGSWAGPVGVAVAASATFFVEIARQGHELRENTEKADEFLKGGGLDEAIAKTLSGDALQEATTLQSALKLSAKQLQDLAATHPEVFTDAGTTQGIIDAAKVCDISAQNVQGFVDALAKDSPTGYQELLKLHQLNQGGATPLTQAANLFTFVTGMKTTGAFVRAQSPQLFGPVQDARRTADIQYEQLTHRSADEIEGLLASNGDPAFQAEIIQIMQNNKTLDGFVNVMRTSPSANVSWLDSVKAALNAADSSGVLTHAQANDYRQRLGWV
jgi:hypothetical protein